MSSESGQQGMTCSGFRDEINTTKTLKYKDLILSYWSYKLRIISLKSMGKISTFQTHSRPLKMLPGSPMRGGKIDNPM